MQFTIWEETMKSQKGYAQMYYFFSQAGACEQDTLTVTNPGIVIYSN